MTAFMDLFFFSAIVLAGAGRQKKIAQWIARATADFSRYEIAKIQIVATQKWAWIPPNIT